MGATEARVCFGVVFFATLAGLAGHFFEVGGLLVGVSILTLVISGTAMTHKWPAIQ